MPIRRLPIRRGDQVNNYNRGTPRKSVFKRLRKVMLYAAIAGVLVVGSFVAWTAKDLPDLNHLNVEGAAESTKIYDRTGTNVLYEFGTVHRTWVPLADISPYVKNATIAVEDKDFYKHKGISIRGILRSAVSDLQGKPLQGGSSITQQLIRNTILTRERTISRKIKEAILAMELEQRYSKDQILEAYLNIVPYGSNAAGIESAAQTFFGTSAKDLTLAQAALLASLPNGPTYYSPYGSHTEQLFNRQKNILSKMAEQGYISEEEAKTAKEVQLTFQKRVDSITAPHFVFYVREQLENEYGATILNEGGLKVITTLDSRMQKAAEDAVDAQAPKNKLRGANNASMVAIDPKTGEILAMVGSVDYFDEENDGNVNVSIMNRSPGSSFKPFVYAQMLKKGYTTETVLDDVPIDFGTAAKAYKPNNYNKKFSGPVTMRSALAQSLNVPAVEALYIAGLHDSLNLAEQMGFTTLNDPDRYGLSLVLGGGEVKLVDLVGAYGVFATEGIKHSKQSILKVQDTKGRVLFNAEDKKEEGKQVLDKEVAKMVTDILSDNNARAPMFGLNSPLQLGTRPVAAKTGTAQEYRDGWTVGYTPSLVAGVWVGNNNNTPMRTESGVDAAAPIWNNFMKTVLAGTPVENFNKPEKVTPDKEILAGKIPEKTFNYDQDTNTILPQDCGVPIGKATKFIEFHSLLRYVQKDAPLSDPPGNPESDPMYSKWESGVASWSEQYNKEKGNAEGKMYVQQMPDPTCDASMLEGRPNISFTSPVDQTIKNSPVKVSAEINAESKITKVEFFADDAKIGEKSEEPWEAAYKFPKDKSGRVTLKIKATTEDKKIGQATRTIYVNPDSTMPKVTLSYPKNNETISPFVFPIKVKITASDPSGIRAVDALIRVVGSDKTSRIGRIETEQPNNIYEIPWNETPAPGEYNVWASATDKTGNKTDTSPITIKIP